MSQKTHGIVYRPEIDGLRAVAVIPVILFHGGVKYVTGGFVGVDVFFVISGFLIGSIIYHEVSCSTFTLASFYNRRIRRIMPMLFVVQIFCAILSFLTFLPNQLISFSKSSLFTSIFISNVWFWSQASYFSPTSELMPLLHTWSLAVEEQFYIFFPVLLMLLSSRVRLIPIIIISIVVLSFALCIVLTARSPSAAFFLIPTRAWELLAGSVLAIIPFPVTSKLRESLSGVGLLLIIYAILSFDQFTQFPGAAAVLPVVGAVLIIYGGGQTLTGRLLSTPKLVMIGKMSYSMYLWHWPIFVFMKQAGADVVLGAPSVIFGIFLTFCLSYFSWRFIETPCRRAVVVPNIVFAGAAAATCFAMSPALLALAGSGFPQRFTMEALGYTKATYSESGEACLAKSTKDPSALCSFGSASPSFLFWGDSHAGAIFPAVEISARKAGRSGLFAGFNACPPLLIEPRYLRGRDTVNCKMRNSLILDKIKHMEELKTIVITAFWSKYDIDEGDLHAIANAAAGKELIILDDTPTPGFDVPWVLALKGGLPKPILPPAEPAVLKLARRWPNVRVIRLSEALCDTKICAPKLGEHPLYSDSNHVSQYAAEVLLGPFLERSGFLLPRAAAPGLESSR